MIKAIVTGESINAKGFKNLGLLGTKFTMGEEFYRARLQKKFGIEVIVPSEEDQNVIHKVIYSELVQGVINERTRMKYYST